MKRRGLIEAVTMGSVGLLIPAPVFAPLPRLGEAPAEGAGERASVGPAPGDPVNERGLQSSTFPLTRH
jgi:hypothetical protein